MKCPFCGETENLHIDLDYDKPDLPIDDVLCNECGKYLSDFINKQHDLDPEYGQIIKDHFWELVDNNTMISNNQIPTAAEFLNRDESGVFNEVDITQAMEEYAKLHVERIKQFLYEEICERRDYSASKMCHEVIKFIERNEQR
jgi:hypothetical protein